MPKQKPKFRLFSAVLATVCIILVADAVAPTASIGNSQYLWWLIMIIGFFIPYALISAELGTQYPSEGGMYTWIKEAFGKKWASRVAWFYWVNYPLWIASLADLATTLLLDTVFGVEMTIQLALLIQVAYTFIVTALGMMRISQTAWFANMGAIVKFIILAGIGGLGIYVLITQGTANPIESWHDFIPLLSADGGIDVAGLGFVSLIIFNMLGFEVVSTFYDDMDKPKKQVPQAIILGGLLIAIFYLLPSFGIGVGTPFSEISEDTGLLESYELLLGSVGLAAGAVKAIITVVALLFVYTLIANISSWNFGVYSVIAFAAKDGMFPKSWAKLNKDGVPYVVGIWTGVVALVLEIVGIVLTYCFPDFELGSSLFWGFFDLSLTCLLMSYIPMFLAFIKLHRRGVQDKKGYWIKANGAMTALMGIVPFILLLASLYFTLFPDLVPYAETFSLGVSTSEEAVVEEEPTEEVEEELVEAVEAKELVAGEEVETVELIDENAEEDEALVEEEEVLEEEEGPIANGILIWSTVACIIVGEIMVLRVKNKKPKKATAKR